MSRRSGRRNRPRGGRGGGGKRGGDNNRQNRSGNRDNRSRNSQRQNRRGNDMRSGGIGDGPGGAHNGPNLTEYVRRPGRIETRNGTITITRDYWKMFPDPGEPLYIVIGDVEFEAEVRSYNEPDERGNPREIRELDLEFMGGNITFSKNRILKFVRREDEVHGYVYEMSFIPIENDEEEGE